MKIKVLFLCATNGLQSAMAEALLERKDSEHFEATSAGIECGEIHPITVEVMKEIGINLEGKQSTPVIDVLDRTFDFVITMDDRTKARRPQFSKAEHVHWQFDDPMTVADPQKQKHMFQTVRDQIAQRIHLFALVQVRFKTFDINVAAEGRPELPVLTSSRFQVQSAGRTK